MQVDPCEIEEFNEKVDEVSRLIEGLRSGKISPEYIDSKINDKSDDNKENNKAKEKNVDISPAKMKELKRKVAELRERKIIRDRAREKFLKYSKLKDKNNQVSTDYKLWDLWCPSDDEDELFNSCTPNNPQFKAMENDINERHAKMVKRRQVAERKRVEGNNAFCCGQYLEAYKIYCSGLDVQKCDLTLQCNAAMACIKNKCYIQAIEHCNKALHVAEFLLEKPSHPLCAKALFRRGIAHRELKHFKEAITDFEKIINLDPSNEEAKKELANTLEENKEYSRENKLILKINEKENNDNKINEIKSLVVKMSKGDSFKKMTKGLGSDLITDKIKFNCLNKLSDLLESEEYVAYFLKNDGILLMQKELKYFMDKKELKDKELYSLLRILRNLSKTIKNRKFFVNSKFTYEILYCLCQKLKKGGLIYTEEKIWILFGDIINNFCEREYIMNVFAKEITQNNFQIIKELIILIGVNKDIQIPLMNSLSMLSRSTFIKCYFCKNFESIIEILEKTKKSSNSFVITDLQNIISNLSFNKKLLNFMCNNDLIQKWILDLFIKSLSFPFKDVRACLLAALSLNANLLIDISFSSFMLSNSEIFFPLLRSIGISNDVDILNSYTTILSRFIKHENFKKFYKDIDILEQIFQINNALDTIKKSDISRTFNKKDEDKLYRIYQNVYLMLAKYSIDRNECEIADIVNKSLLKRSIELMIEAKCTDNTKGNISFLFSNIVEFDEYLCHFIEEKLIKSLLDIILKSGYEAKKNAAIALAKISKNKFCKDILRKYDGFQIIYSHLN